MSQKTIFGICIILSALSVNAQAIELIEISPFLRKAYTNNFTKGTDISIDLSTVADGTKSEDKLIVSQSPGKSIKKYGKEWISVDFTGAMKFLGEETTVRGMELYHPTSGLLQYIVDFDDDSVENYRWINMPKSMKSGEMKQVGKVNEKTKNGKLISSGTLALKVEKIKDGYRFCTIQTSTDVATKEKMVIYDCELFDDQKIINGTYVEFRFEKNVVLSGTGEIKLR